MARALELEKQANVAFIAGFEVLGLRGGETPAVCARAWVNQREQLAGVVAQQRHQIEVVLAALRQWKALKLGDDPKAIEGAERVLLAMADMRVLGSEG